MRVDIEELEKMRDRRKEINSAGLGDIKWFHKDREFIPPKKEVEAWKFIGLSNTEFPFYSTIKESPAPSPKPNTSYVYCPSCGYEDFDCYVGYSRTTANGDWYLCPGCGEETSNVDIGE